jgi:putative toxin-antitoxin system antitoxin component (TIGR02293 family)
MASKHTPKGAARLTKSAAAAPKVSALVVGERNVFNGVSSFVTMLVHESEPSRIADAIVSGRVSGSDLRALRSKLRLTVDDMAKLLDIAARTINRKERFHGALSISEGDRAFRIARIADLAVELIGDREKALAWLRTSNTYLGDKTPFEMLDTEVGCDLVTESLHTIAFGGVA